MLKAIYRDLESESEDLKAFAAEGLCKLYLVVETGGTTTTRRLPQALMERLIELYFSSSGNDQLRQCLTLFFQIYPNSMPSHQQLLADCYPRVFFDVLEASASSSSVMFTNQLLHWIDPSQLIPSNHNDSNESIVIDYFKLANEISKQAIGRPSASIKAALQFISKLPFKTDSVDNVIGLFNTLEELKEVLMMMLYIVCYNISQDLTEKTSLAQCEKIQLKLQKFIKAKDEEDNEETEVNEDNGETDEVKGEDNEVNEETVEEETEETDE